MRFFISELYVSCLRQACYSVLCFQTVIIGLYFSEDYIWTRLRIHIFAVDNIFIQYENSTTFYQVCTFAIITGFRLGDIM